MPVVQADGVELHTQQLGKLGSCIVMVHGLLIGTQATWYLSVAPRLAANHRVTTYDLRGHGMSQRPSSDYGLRTMARDLCRVIDSASPEPVALVGHSFGGAVALRYTIDHPERVSHLILVETPLPIMSPDSLQFFFAQSLDTLAGLLPESQQQTLTQSKRPGRLSRQILELITHTSMNEDILAEPDISDDELSQIAAPVLLCYGTRSALGPADRERLLRALPNARLEMLEGGHFLPNERPDEIAALIEAFLNG